MPGVVAASRIGRVGQVRMCSKSQTARGMAQLYINWLVQTKRKLNPNKKKSSPVEIGSEIRAFYDVRVRSSHSDDYPS